MSNKTFLSFTAAALLLVAAGAQAQQAYTAGDTEAFAGPGDDYPLIADVDAGFPLQVYGCTGGFTWCDVGFDGNRGWIDGRDIEFPYGEQRLPVVEYGPRFRLPIITFTIGSYWDRWYYDRPFYVERPRSQRHAPPPVYWEAPRRDWDHRDHDRHDNDWRDRDHDHDGRRDDHRDNHHDGDDRRSHDPQPPRPYVQGQGRSNDDHRRDGDQQRRRDDSQRQQADQQRNQERQQQDQQRQDDERRQQADRQHQEEAERLRQRKQQQRQQQDEQSRQQADQQRQQRDQQRQQQEQQHRQQADQQRQQQDQQRQQREQQEQQRRQQNPPPQQPHGGDRHGHGDDDGRDHR